MGTATAALWSLAGLVALTLGADSLVRGASRLAAHFGVSPLAIGLTVVAYGTSAPEIVASVVAAMEGHSDVTLGNVIGSNIANMGLILGATAIVAPLAIAPSLFRLELPFMVVTTGLFAALGFGLELYRHTGILFLGLLVVFNYLSFRLAKLLMPEKEFESPQRKSALVTSLALTAFGLLILIGGAHLLVEGAVSLARAVGISELVIGVTLVAVGTSLPELATSVVAGLRQQTDLVVGNIIGSNLFNILGALGLSATIRPIRIEPEILRFEMPALVLFTLAMALFLYTGKRLVRWEGVALLSAYAAFIALLFS